MKISRRQILSDLKTLIEREAAHDQKVRERVLEQVNSRIHPRGTIWLHWLGSKKEQMATKNPKETEELNCEITKLIDNCPCSYEEVIGVLEKQIKFMRTARKQEHPPRRVSKRQIVKDLKTLSNRGEL